MGCLILVIEVGGIGVVDEADVDATRRCPDHRPLAARAYIPTCARRGIAECIPCMGASSPSIVS